MTYYYQGARHDLFIARYLYRSPVSSNIYEQPPALDRKQQSPRQHKQYNGGYPLYENKGYTPSTVSKNTNEYEIVVDTKNQVCIKTIFEHLHKRKKLKSKEHHERNRTVL